MASGDELGETATSAPSLAASARAADSFRAGDVLGRYTIERVLGAGGMGLVYAAHDPDLDRRVAIKVLRGDASEESRVRLLREARAMAKLSHPNVITVYEVGTANGVDFVAMELLEGGTLAEWLRAERRPPAEVLKRLRAAGAGLVAAHARGLVHRDFKPANVLLGRDGQVVVTDFGLARGFDSDVNAETLPAPVAAPSAPTKPAAASVALDETMAAPPTPTPAPRSRPGDLSTTLTRTGAVLGTPAYMAPEQFAGQQVGPAADQFAFAVAMWEGLTGARPFRGDTLEQMRAAVERGAPSAAVLPRAVRPVLVRALARDAAARWPDMAALLAALDRRTRRPGRLAGIAVVLAGVAVVPTVYLTNELFKQVDDAGVPALAALVAREVGVRAARLGVTPRELQLDCDWTDTTRARYFAFLTALRGAVAGGTALSATIRLHQIKYRERTGVPPVDRGMLMFYNMGRFSADPEARAIFDAAAAARYLARLADYPLPLDGALPIWSWTLHLRDDQVEGLLQSTDPDELAGLAFVQPAGPDRYLVTRTAFLHGTLLRAGDILKIEVTGPAETQAAAGMLAAHLAAVRAPRTIALFDLSERNLARHDTSHLDQVFRTAR